MQQCELGTFYPPTTPEDQPARVACPHKATHIVLKPRGPEQTGWVNVCPGHARMVDQTGGECMELARLN